MSHHKQCLASSRIPPAVGPYSQAVRAGGLLFCSGLVPLDPETRKIVDGDITVQTRRVLDNLALLLEDLGATLADVVRTTVFLKDLNDFAQLNATYGEYFAQDPPARSTLQVSRIPLDALVEIEAVVALPH